MRILRVFQGCHAAGLSGGPQVHGPLHRCKAARLQGCSSLPRPSSPLPWLTLLPANRLAKASNERAPIEARLEIEAIVAKVVKDLRIYHNLCFHLLHLVARRLCKRSRLFTLLQVYFLS